MFKIGDIVTGLTENPYFITSSHGTFKIVEFSGPRTFRVEVISHEHHAYCIGYRVWAEVNQFKLVTSFDYKETVLRKIAHLHNLFENRKQEKKTI